MPYEIELTEDSKRDIQALRSFERRKILDAIEGHLRHEPTKESQSRIKRLRELARPQYRLRVDDIRIFYDQTPSGRMACTGRYTSRAGHADTWRGVTP
jgi:mRNA interferase RelE/StbE